jgi:hypothetical protein
VEIKIKGMGKMKIIVNYANSVAYEETRTDNLFTEISHGEVGAAPFFVID